jgi:hypothetical protein
MHRQSETVKRAFEALEELAIMLGEPMGVRLRLMAEELSDLSPDSVEHAVKMWGRGDKSHLKSQLRDDTRIGIVFPAPAELREIAMFYLAQQREEEGLRELDETRISEQRPELYRSLQCPRCGEPMTSLSPMELRFMADVVERRQWLKGACSDAE